MTLGELQYLLWLFEESHRVFFGRPALFTAEIDGDTMCAHVYAEQMGEERCLIKTVELS